MAQSEALAGSPRPSPGRNRIGAAVLGVALTALIAGCGGLHLHNPADEALARKAGDTFKAADVAAFVAAERKVLAAAHERDLAATRRNLAAERDAAIVVALSEGRKASDLDAYFKGRLVAIGIPDDPAARKRLHGLPDRRQQALVARDAYIVSVSQKAVAPPAFPPSADDEKGAEGVGDPTILLLFRAYQTAANDYTADLRHLRALKSGRLGDVNEQLRKAGELQTELAAEIKTKVAKLNELVEAYKKTETAQASSGDAIAPQLTKAVHAFDEIARTLEAKARAAGLEDLLAETRLAKLQELRTHLGGFLTAFSQAQSAPSETAPARLADAEAAGRAAAVLVNAGDLVRNASIRAKLVPLVFEQERVRLEILRAQRAVDRGKARVALLERKRESLISEGVKLVDAVNTLHTASGGNAAKVLKELRADPTAKGPLLHAVFVWAESIAIDKLRQEEADVALISLDHEQALDASEFALALWKHMIATPLEELVGYHASGIKSQDIANLINAAGLAGVAVGVNR
jgi:hypothetical protein